MENEKDSGITIKELKDFIGKLPTEFDSYSIVNGEVIKLTGSYYARVDKPVIHLEIDEKNKEFLMLHQPEEEIDEIKNSTDGDTN